MGNPHDVGNGKPHLVLVHSFYANSILLRGLGEFLSDEFHVHFIDLPGFAAHEPPIAEVSLDGFARHVEARVPALGLETISSPASPSVSRSSAG